MRSRSVADMPGPRSATSSTAPLPFWRTLTSTSPSAYFSALPTRLSTTRSTSAASVRTRTFGAARRAGKIGGEDERDHQLEGDDGNGDHECVGDEHQQRQNAGDGPATRNQDDDRREHPAGDGRQVADLLAADDRLRRRSLHGD